MTKRKTKKIDLTVPPPKPVPPTFKKLTPKNEHQRQYIQTVKQNEIILVNGVAGTGKTCVAVGLAVDMLRECEVGKIIFLRPAVEVDEKIGFLPGDASEKLSFYTQPMMDELSKFASKEETSVWKSKGMLKVLPVGFARGLNFHNAAVIIDEASNCTESQLKMLITRIGIGSKMILVGDCSQSDLAFSKAGGFAKYLNALDGVRGVGVVHLPESCVVRNPLIVSVLEALDRYEGR